MDKADEPGSHWIALCNIPTNGDNNQFGYFDSFGLIGMNSVYKSTDKEKLNLSLTHVKGPSISALIQNSSFSTTSSCICKEFLCMRITEYLTPRFVCHCRKVFNESRYSSFVEYYQFNPQLYDPKICNIKLQ